MLLKIAIVCAISKGMITSFEYRESNPAALFPSYQAVSDYSIPGAISNPAYLTLPESSYLSLAGAKPYSLIDLNVSTLRVGTGNKYFGVQLGWNRFGFDEYLENVFEGNLGIRPFRWISLGFGVHYLSLAISTDEINRKYTAWEGVCSILIMPADWLEISFVHHNIASYFVESNGDAVLPSWSAGIALKPIQGFSCIWNTSKNTFGYENSISFSVKMLSFLSIQAGYCRELSSYSAAITFLYKRLMVSYGIRYHPYLGSTHSIGVTAFLSPEKFDGIRYGPDQRLSEKVEKIDITDCTENDLMEIPLLKEKHAARIIKYREKIGPITKESLYQIGMMEKEVSGFLNYVYGLKERESSYNKKKFHSNRYYNAGRKRKIFQRLIVLGVRATTAMGLIDLAYKGKRNDFVKVLNNEPAVNSGNRKAIQSLCFDLSP